MKNVTKNGIILGAVGIGTGLVGSIIGGLIATRVQRETVELIKNSRDDHKKVNSKISELSNIIKKANDRFDDIEKGLRAEFKRIDELCDNVEGTLNEKCAKAVEKVEKSVDLQVKIMKQATDKALADNSIISKNLTTLKQSTSKALDFQAMTEDNTRKHLNTVKDADEDIQRILKSVQTVEAKLAKLSGVFDELSIADVIDVTEQSSEEVNSEEVSSDNVIGNDNVVVLKRDVKAKSSDLIDKIDEEPRKSTKRRKGKSKPKVE